MFLCKSVMVLRERRSCQMVLSEQRKGEIAYTLLMHQHREQGLEISANLRRSVGNIAKQIDVPFEELLAFHVDLARELLSEIAAAKKQGDDEGKSGARLDDHGFGSHIV